MKIIIDGEEYELKMEQAIAAGVLKKKREFNITLTEDEFIVLRTILSYVGGSPKGARGQATSIARKLDAIDTGSLTTDLDLSLNNDSNAINRIYFK